MMGLSGESENRGKELRANTAFKRVNLRYTNGNAGSVTVVGDFNGWDSQSHPMAKQIDGSWQIELELSIGHHHYALMVDDKLTLDPKAHGVARNEKGERISLLSVSGY